MGTPSFNHSDMSLWLDVVRDVTVIHGRKTVKWRFDLCSHGLIYAVFWRDWFFFCVCFPGFCFLKYFGYVFSVLVVTNVVCC